MGIVFTFVPVSGQIFDPWVDEPIRLVPFVFVV